MKLMHFIAAGLLMAGIGVSSEASAQRWDGQGREWRGDRGDRHWNGRDNRRWDRDDRRRWDRRDNRRWDRGYNRGWDRGRHRGWDRRWDRRGWGWNGGRHCRTVWRYGQRYRVCR